MWFSLTNQKPKDHLFFLCIQKITLKWSLFFLVNLNLFCTSSKIFVTSTYVATGLGKLVVATPDRICYISHSPKMTTSVVFVLVSRFVDS